MKFKSGMPDKLESQLRNPTSFNFDYHLLSGRATLWGLLIVAPVAYAVWFVAHGAHPLGGWGSVPLHHLAAGVICLIVVHELAHASLHPGFGLSDKTLLGVVPRSFLFYATYLEPVGRNRLLAITAAPFVLLTVAPLVASFFVSRDWMLPLAALSIFNAVAATGDMAIFWRVSRVVPRDAYIQGDEFGVLADADEVTTH